MYTISRGSYHSSRVVPFSYILYGSHVPFVVPSSFTRDGHLTHMPGSLLPRRCGNSGNRVFRLGLSAHYAACLDDATKRLKQAPTNHNHVYLLFVVVSKSFSLVGHQLFYLLRHDLGVGTPRESRWRFVLLLLSASPKYFHPSFFFFSNNDLHGSITYTSGCCFTARSKIYTLIQLRHRDRILMLHIVLLKIIYDP
jgi:hypothetical protein